MSNIKKLILIFVPILAATLFAAFYYYQESKEIQKYDFVLQSANGEVKLKDFRGKKTLVYFGYGLCPDICPTTLYEIATALNALTPLELDSVRVVFVSVDPARDKPEVLDTFAGYFHESIIGATADEAYIQKLAKNYGVSYKKVPQPDSAIGYSVGHSADIYLIDEKGRFVKSLPFGISAKEIAQAIKE